MTYDQNSTPIDSDSVALTNVAKPVYQTAQTVSVMDNVLLHAAGIKTAWNKQVAGIIETGQLLLQAKKALSGSGKFLKLFDPNIGNLPFCEDTAQLLMKIARHPVLSKAEHVRYLPPHWGTLAILSRATSKQLEKWIADGSVNIDTDRSKADELVGTKKKRVKKVPAVSNDDTATDDDGDDAATGDDVATATADATNEQHCIKYLKALHRLLTDAAAVEWEMMFKKHEDLIRDVRCELTGRIEAHEEAVARDQAWEESQKLLN
jgi:hypothetical protein